MPKENLTSNFLVTGGDSSKCTGLNALRGDTGEDPGVQRGGGGGGGGAAGAVEVPGVDGVPGAAELPGAAEVPGPAEVPEATVVPGPAEVPGAAEAPSWGDGAPGRQIAKKNNHS